ncbi:hypothetical protein [Streptomyces sp. NPDC102437]|uniref:hypothetical protein n=1 Tax=Streptomyces sp. NPDC102437 TaxID=3366175 RepID=UPI0037FCA379
MADKENQIIVWFLVGSGAGFVLMLKLYYAGALPHDKDIRMLVALGGTFAVGFLFGVIGEHLHDEVAQQKISRATYWTTVFGIAVASFTLLGITGVDDLAALFRRAGYRDLTRGVVMQI